MPKSIIFRYINRYSILLERVEAIDRKEEIELTEKRAVGIQSCPFEYWMERTVLYLGFSLVQLSQGDGLCSFVVSLLFIHEWLLFVVFSFS